MGTQQKRRETIVNRGSRQQPAHLPLPMHHAFQGFPRLPDSIPGSQAHSMDLQVTQQPCAMGCGSLWLLLSLNDGLFRYCWRRLAASDGPTSPQCYLHGAASHHLGVPMPDSPDLESRQRKWQCIGHLFRPGACSCSNLKTDRYCFRVERWEAQYPLGLAVANQYTPWFPPNQYSHQEDQIMFEEHQAKHRMVSSSYSACQDSHSQLSLPLCLIKSTHDEQISLGLGIVQQQPWWHQCRFSTSGLHIHTIYTPSDCAADPGTVLETEREFFR